MATKAPNQNRSTGKLLIFALAIAYFATITVDVLVSLQLVDIAASFQVQVGTAGQIRSVSSIAAIATALLMGLLSIRFKHKPLLLTGVLCIGILSIGCFFASNLATMSIFYALNGVGSVIVFPMAVALAGDFFSIEKRTKAVGWIVASSSISYIIGAPIVSFFAGAGGWQFVLLSFVLPVSVIGMILVYFSIPKEPHKKNYKVDKQLYITGFKQVFLNKSAVACLICTAFYTATVSTIQLFAISFYRQKLLVPLDFTFAIMVGGTLSFTIGCLIASRLANKFGRRIPAAIASALAGVFVLLFLYMPSFWVALPFDYLGAFFGGMATSAGVSLSLEQVPKFRGTMMSLNTAFSSLGVFLGSALGGVVLELFSYGELGLTLGTTGFFAAIIYYFVTKDPNKQTIKMMVK